LFFLSKTIKNKIKKGFNKQSRLQTKTKRREGRKEERREEERKGGKRENGYNKRRENFVLVLSFFLSSLLSLQFIHSVKIWEL
jgi:hypothetical protein